jgi:hypothetical protein
MEAVVAGAGGRNSNLEKEKGPALVFLQNK